MRAIHWGVLVMTLGFACIARTQVVSKSLANHDSSKERFGAWHLVRIDAPTADGKSTGALQPKGMLIYTRDGHMSVQLMYPAAAKAPDNQLCQERL
jgi:hypothetical protein